MKNKIYITTLFAIVIAMSSCKKKTEQIQNTHPPGPVKVSTAFQDNGQAVVTASGTVEAVNSADLSTRVMGFVEIIHVQVGDKIRKGQLLLSINSADLSAKLAQAEAGISEAKSRLASARKDFDRYTNLFREASASQKELDDMTTQKDLAEARLEIAKQLKNEVSAQLSYTNILAPFDGRVSNKFIKTGDMASPGIPLLEVESPGIFQVMVMMPESDILHIKTNSEVDVEVKSMYESVKGKVVEVSSSAKNTGGQFLVKVALNDNNTNLRSGMFATVDFPVSGNAPTSVFISSQALVTQGQLSGVYTVSQNNTAILRWLRLGKSVGDQVEVLSGITADEIYIESANKKLYNGVKISIQ